MDPCPEFRILSLCTGIAGIEVGIRRVIPGARTVCMVEREAFACALLVAKMQEGFLDDCPIWTDLLTFDGRPWRGKVHCVTAGFPCFATGTLVLTEHGYRPIESLAVGDRVLTGRGRWCPITATMSREDASLRRVRAGSTVVTTTDEHPFWARKRSLGWDNAKRRYVRQFDEPRWIEAQNLTTDHFVAQVLPEPKLFGKSNSFWWLVGRYLADGWRVRRLDRSAGNSGRVVICCARDECDELARRISETGFHATRVDERTVAKFHIVNREFYRFTGHFGRLAHGKTIHRGILELDTERARSFFEGYFSGDGHTEKRWGERRITTVSRPLALGIALLAQRAYGVVAGVRKCCVPSKTVIEGRLVNQRNYYVVSIPPRNRSAFIEGSYGWRRVTANTSYGSGDVYNIAVDEDESYVAEGSVVHNCQPWSTAGKRAGVNDERWIWSHIFRIIREVEPPLVFIENVPGLISGRGLNLILRDLAEDGYNAVWDVFSAQEVGAPHLRKRVFILAWRRELANPQFPRGNRVHVGQPSGYLAPDTRRAHTRLSSQTSPSSDQPGAEHGTVAGNWVELADTVGVRGARRGVSRDMAGTSGDIEAQEEQRERRWDTPDDRSNHVAHPGCKLAVSRFFEDRSRCAEKTGNKAHGRLADRGRELADASSTRRDHGQDAKSDRGHAPEGTRCPELERERRELADAESRGKASTQQPGQLRRLETQDDDVGNAHVSRLEGLAQHDRTGAWSAWPTGQPFPPGPSDLDAWRRILADDWAVAPALEPDLRRVADGVSEKLDADRTDRLRALGNGVVPATVEVAFRTLAGAIFRDLT